MDDITLDGTTIKPGQYFTVPGHGFFCAGIRFFTHAPVAHAVVYVGRQPNGYDCIQAEPGGVGWTTVQHWVASGKVYPSKRVITDAQSALATQYALTCIGEPYSFLNDTLIGIREGFGIHQVSDLEHWKPIADIHHVECAQLADLVGIQGGVPYFDDGRLPGQVSPADLWRLDYR